MGNTKEQMTVTRTTTDVNPPTAMLMIRSRADVSPNSGLLSRPLVPYVLVVKSSMAALADTAPTDRFSAAPLRGKAATVLLHASRLFLHAGEKAVSVGGAVGTL